LTAIKPEPKYLHWPNTANANNTMKHSELEANTYKQKISEKNDYVDGLKSRKSWLFLVINQSWSVVKEINAKA